MRFISIIRKFLFCSALGLMLASAAAQNAKPPLPAVALERANNGEAAIAAMGEKLPEVARHYGLEAAELRAKFRQDSDLWVDTEGQLYFAESHTPDETTQPTTAETTSTATAPVPLDQTFRLHSRPGAARKIYLDFDGHTTSGTSWKHYATGSTTFYTPPYDFDGNPGSFSSAELERIQYIWQRVVEDYAPFDVDVTTEDPGLEALRKTSSTDSAYGIRVCIGGSSSDWYSSGSYGGVAYLGSFDWNSDTPCYVFEENLGNGNEKYIAEAISHEVGHTVDLYHDGTSTTGYYSGHGSGADAWAPIMGVGYSKAVVQFSRGEYSGANNTEDDLAKISASYNIPYLPDDYGNDMANAAALPAGSFQVSGRIGRPTDVDFFRFETGGGDFSFGVAVDARSPNLNVELTLLNASGGVLAVSNPPDTLGATLALKAMPAGTYFLKVDGVGAGNPLNTGYSDYGSIGAYTLSGSVAGSAGPIAIAAVSASSGPAPLSVQFSSQASHDPDGHITSYLWTFGDGGSSTSANPSYIYRTPGTYTATLQVTDNSGLKGADSLLITVQGPPTAPSALTAAAACNGGDPNYAAISMAWKDNSDNETLFRVQWSVDGATWPAPGSGTQEATTTDASYIHGWLSFGTTRYYRVRAENTFGASAWSATAAATTHLVPTTAPALSASATSGSQVTLTWNAVANATGYRLERSLNQTSWSVIATPPAGVLSYTDSGLSTGTTYYYRIMASGHCGYATAPSAAAMVTTQADTAIAAPNKLTARAASTSQINLSWRDNATNETGYYVEILNGGSWARIATLPADSTKYTSSGLVASTTYSYRVQAFNAAAKSDYSETASAATSKVTGKK
jgi:PKD repeat protein